MQGHRNADGTTAVNLTPDMLNLFRSALRADIACCGRNLTAVADTDTAQPDVMGTLALIAEDVAMLDHIGWWGD